MLFELKGESEIVSVGSRYQPQPASSLSVREKAIENWIASNPGILLPGEEVLVFAQSVSRKHMADVLALDSSGSLVVIEIKRDWSDRSTVAQLLEYAAEMHEAGYERLNRLAQAYPAWRGGDLHSAFREFAEAEEFPEEELGKSQRLIIVAPEADQGLRAIVQWLQDYGVPIEWAPFQIYGDENGAPRILAIEGVEPPSSGALVAREWKGHWIHNTNETNSPGAYKRMFERGVAAIWGYPNGPANLEGSRSGEIVFAYVNGKGLLARGTVVDGQVQSGQGIFLTETGEQEPGEYHLAVKWSVLLPEEQGITSKQAKALGYDLPVRTVFGKLWRGELAKRIEAEMEARRRLIPWRSSSV